MARVQFNECEQGETMPAIQDIGVDLGTSHILIYMRGRGIVLREPAVVAVDRDLNRVVAMGEDAYRLIGRTPGNIQAIRPLRQGAASTSTRWRYTGVTANPGSGLAAR